MFYPFRKNADLKEDEDNWWTAYLKKKTAVECNSAALATLSIRFRIFMKVFVDLVRKSTSQIMSLTIPTK